MNDIIFSFQDKTGELSLLNLIGDVPRKINAIAIGRVEKVKDGNTADISIVYKRESGINYPLLSDVPLVVLQGGGKYIKFPVRQGDFALLFFCDKDISVWSSSGAEGQIPPTGRSHSISDAIALVGVNSSGTEVGGESDKVQFCGKGNNLVRWNELNSALTKFYNELKASMTSTLIAGNNAPQTSWTAFPEGIDISKAKTPSVETE